MVSHNRFFVFPKNVQIYFCHPILRISRGSFSTTQIPDCDVRPICKYYFLYGYIIFITPCYPPLNLTPGVKSIKLMEEEILDFAGIREFIDDMPAMKHNVEFTCDHCKHENKTVLEGMQAFFS